jgi:hypothetical protein
MDLAEVPVAVAQHSTVQSVVRGIYIFFPISRDHSFSLRRLSWDFCALTRQTITIPITWRCLINGKNQLMNEEISLKVKFTGNHLVHSLQLIRIICEEYLLSTSLIFF